MLALFVVSYITVFIVVLIVIDNNWCVCVRVCVCACVRVCVCVCVCVQPLAPPTPCSLTIQRGESVFPQSKWNWNTFVGVVVVAEVAVAVVMVVLEVVMVKRIGYQRSCVSVPQPFWTLQWTGFTWLPYITDPLSFAVSRFLSFSWLLSKPDKYRFLTALLPPWFSIRPADRLVGLKVKSSASREVDLGLIPAFAADFFLFFLFFFF